MPYRKRFVILSFVAIFSILTSLLFVHTAQAQGAFGEAGWNPPLECRTGKQLGECSAQPYSTRFFCNGSVTGLYAYSSTPGYSQSASAPCDNNNYQAVWASLCASVMVGGIVDVRNDTQKEQGCCPPQLAGSCTPNNMGNPGNDCSSSPNSPNIGYNSSANLKSGNLFHSQEVGDLTFSYNSSDVNYSALGKNWTHNYNLKITALSDNATLVLRNNDGNIIYFSLAGNIYYPEAISGDTSSIVKNSNNTYTRTAKSGTIYNFDTSGKLTSITDKNGNTNTLTYYYGYLSGITDKNGRTTTITSPSRISTISDPMGRNYALAYDGRGFLSSVTDSLGNVWNFTYDNNGRMLTKKDPLNNTTTYTYDYQGRVLTATDPESKTRSMNYVGSGATNLTEKDGSVWRYKYDPIYAVKTEKTDPLGNATNSNLHSR